MRTRGNEAIVHVVWTVLIGCVTGLLARLLTPARDMGGLVASTAVGIAGASLAAYAMHLTDCCRGEELVELIGAVLGAVILLTIDRLARSKPF